MGTSEVGGCESVLHYLWLYLDHEAPPRTCAELEEHLKVCASCRRAVHFDRKLKQLVRRCADPPEPVPVRAVESLRVRIEAVLRSEPPAPRA